MVDADCSLAQSLPCMGGVQPQEAWYSRGVRDVYALSECGTRNRKMYSIANRSDYMNEQEELGVNGVRRMIYKELRARHKAALEKKGKKDGTSAS